MNKITPQQIQKEHKALLTSTAILEKVKSWSWTDKAIKESKIGLQKNPYRKNGESMLSFPIPNAKGEVIGYRLKDLNPGGGTFWYPKKENGSEEWKGASIYGVEMLEKKSKKPLVVVEGEKDRITALSHGLRAISFMYGAGSFKPEHLEPISKDEVVYVCYDNDESGREGARKVADALCARGNKTYVITLPDEVGDKGDITDYFVNKLGSAEDLLTQYAVRWSVIKPEKQKQKSQQESKKTDWTEEEIYDGTHTKGGFMKQMLEQEKKNRNATIHTGIGIDNKILYFKDKTTGIFDRQGISALEFAYNATQKWDYDVLDSKYSKSNVPKGAKIGITITETEARSVFALLLEQQARELGVGIDEMEKYNKIKEQTKEFFESYKFKNWCKNKPEKALDKLVGTINKKGDYTHGIMMLKVEGSTPEQRTSNYHYNREAVRLFVKGQAQSIVWAGLPFQYNLFIKGEKGCGKSQFCASIAVLQHQYKSLEYENWVEDKKRIENTEGVNVVEIAELSGNSEKDIAAWKRAARAFLLGATLKYDKTGSKVPVGHITIFTNDYTIQIPEVDRTTVILETEAKEGYDLGIKSRDVWLHLLNYYIKDFESFIKKQEQQAENYYDLTARLNAWAILPRKVGKVVIDNKARAEEFVSEGIPEGYIKRFIEKANEEGSTEVQKGYLPHFEILEGLSAYMKEKGGGYGANAQKILTNAMNKLGCRKTKRENRIIHNGVKQQVWLTSAVSQEEEQKLTPKEWEKNDIVNLLPQATTGNIGDVNYTVDQTTQSKTTKARDDVNLDDVPF